MNLDDNVDEHAQRRARSGDSATRAALLDAARRCVAERGLAGATSREITAAAGANLAAITYWFGSKDDLVAEALFEELDARVAPALAELEGDGPPAARMAAAVQRLMVELERSRDQLGAHVEALVLATRDPVYGRRARALHRRITRRLAALIVDLQGAGSVPPWVDPVAMSSLILATAHGIVLQALLDPRGPRPPEMAGQFASLLLASAVPDERP